MLLEEMLRRGAPSLATEISEGRHFDPVQRLTFLEKFEYRDDRRVQGMLRQKATVLRTMVIARMEGEALPDEKPASPSGRQGPSTVASMSSVSVRAGPDASSADPPRVNPAFPGFGSDSLPPPPSAAGDSKAKGAGSKLVNGLVSVGHNDDTTSESDVDQGHQAARGRQKGVTSSERRRPLEDSTDSSSDDRDRRKRDRRRTRPAATAVAAGKPKPPPAQEADLLGGMDSPTPAPTAAPRPMQQEQGDLLGGLLADPSPPTAQQQHQHGQTVGEANLLDF